MMTRIENVAAWLRERITEVPDVAIILGSGLGPLAEEIEAEQTIAYGDIPDFPISTVEGHDGRLIVGSLAGKRVIAMKGRFHYYEGYAMTDVTLPVRVFHQLGVKTLFVSNAAGGLNPGYHVGDLMLITDHINMMPDNPLRGRNLPVGPRFPNMHDVYTPELLQAARNAARELGLTLREGVYVATQGPSFETRAEYRMFRLLGADAVGMSTVPEVIVAAHCGMRCMGISVITNVIQNASDTNHEEVQEAANTAQPRMTAIIKHVLQSL